MSPKLTEETRARAAKAAEDLADAAGSVRASLGQAARQTAQAVQNKAESLGDLDVRRLRDTAIKARSEGRLRLGRASRPALAVAGGLALLMGIGLVWAGLRRRRR